MAEPYLSEIRIVGFTFAPRNWAQCDGQILPINQNQSLYSLLGTTYGGDGRTSFALPDMRGRAALHEGNGHPQGQKQGESTVTLNINEVPSHTHTPIGSGANATSATPAGNLFAIPTTANLNPYAATTANPDKTMAAGMVANAGGGQPHNNMQPYLALNFCICIQGLFPSRN